MKMYFIALVLPIEIDKKVNKHKEFMWEKYGCRVGLKSPAHITIVPPFWMDEEKEQKLINDVKRMCEEQASFSLATKDFAAFKPRTIYIAVEENEQLKKLKQDSDNYFSVLDYKMKNETRPFCPHITIATRDLHKKVFAEAWPFFANHEFREECRAKDISILRHNGSIWEVVSSEAFKE